MKITVYDPDKRSCHSMIKMIRKYDDSFECVEGFYDPASMYGFVEQHGSDVAFIRTDIQGLDAFSYAEKLQQLNRHINIIFVAEKISQQDALRAWSIHPSGYMNVPSEVAHIEDQFKNLRYAGDGTGYRNIGVTEQEKEVCTWQKRF